MFSITGLHPTCTPLSREKLTAHLFVNPGEHVQEVGLQVSIPVPVPQHPLQEPAVSRVLPTLTKIFRLVKTENLKLYITTMEINLKLVALDHKD